MIGESDLSPSPFIGHLQTLVEESVKRLQFTTFETVVALSLPPFLSFLWMMEWQIKATEAAAVTGRLIQASAIVSKYHMSVML